MWVGGILILRHTSGNVEYTAGMSLEFTIWRNAQEVQGPSPEAGRGWCSCLGVILILLVRKTAKSSEREPQGI